jgi:hypothetical protein
MSLNAFGKSLLSQPNLIKARKRKDGKRAIYYNLKMSDTARITNAPGTWSTAQ